MSNYNLLLLSYYVQSSINYIINITENISIASIAEQLRVSRLREFWSLKSRADQILYCTAFCYTLRRNTVNIMKGLKTILKNYHCRYSFLNTLLSFL